MMIKIEILDPATTPATSKTIYINPDHIVAVLPGQETQIYMSTGLIYTTLENIGEQIEAGLNGQ